MTDKLEMLEGLIDELPEAVERRKLADRLGRSMDSLRDADYQIGRLVAVLDLAGLLQLGDVEAELRMLADLRKEAWEIGRALATASTDDALRDGVYDYEHGFKKAIVTAERAVRDRWLSLSTDRFSSIRLLGDLLVSIGVEVDLGRRMQDCASHGLATSGTTMRTADILPHARKLLAELDRLQEERARTIRPGAIGGFINALAERHATLAMVTPEVHTWLAEHGALERFSLSPRQL